MAGMQVSPTSSPFFPSLNQEAVLPPVFIRNQEERPKAAVDQFSLDVPIISLADLNAAGDDSGLRRSSAFKSIVKACEEWGVFQVVDHGIDASLVAAMTELSPRLFLSAGRRQAVVPHVGGRPGRVQYQQPPAGGGSAELARVLHVLLLPIGGEGLSEVAGGAQRVAESGGGVL